MILDDVKFFVNRFVLKNLAKVNRDCGSVSSRCHCHARATQFTIFPSSLCKSLDIHYPILASLLLKRS